MLSDWDLDAAILSASDPCLQLALVKASQREKVTLAGMIYFKVYILKINIISVTLIK